MGFLGTALNVFSVVFFAWVGASFRGKLQVNTQKILLGICGVAAISLGAFGIYETLWTFGEKQIEPRGWILIVFSVAIGLLIGLAFGIFHLLSRLADVISSSVAKSEERERQKKKGTNKRKKSGKADKTAIKKLSFGTRFKKFFTPDLASDNFLIPTRQNDLYSEGFLTAFMLFGFGHLAITGSVSEASGDGLTVLLLKTCFDGAAAFTLGIVYGTIVAYSGVSIAFVQGMFLIFSMIFPQFFDKELVAQLAVIGAFVMLLVGINMAFEKKIKVENLIPAFLVPIIYDIIVLVAKATVAVK